MKRAGYLVLTMAFILSACMPALPSLQQPDDSPAIDADATDQALAATLAVETLNALPTPTLEPATNTSEPTETQAQTATVTATETQTPDPNATPTETITPDPNATPTVTGTIETATPTITGTLPAATQTASLTPTETPYALLFGTLPPALPSGKIKLINKSKADVYVSLTCTTHDGYTTILEYPVDGTMRVAAPAGRYTYNAWVGGRQFQGFFGLGKKEEVEITFEKNKVTTK